MPLPKPVLDNRTYDQLVAEGRGQIPRLCPPWTDHNASDPGITLLELAAWLSEQNIYRFDRPSEQALRTFVRLAGIEPRAPGVASTVVALANGNAAGIALPSRIQLASSTTERFETTAAVFVSTAVLATLANGSSALTDVMPANVALTAFPAFGERPRAASALYLGFDRALDAPGATLSLHFWTDAWRADQATRDALIAEFNSMVDRIKHECSCEDWKQASASADWLRHYRVTTVWEYYAGGGNWLPLKDVVDETRALSLTGFVRFTAPAGHQAGGAGPRFYIRCRIVRGRFECPPRLIHVAFNAVPAEHALSRAERSIGLARGHAHAIFELGEAPVVAGETQLRLDNGAGDVQSNWREVFDWDRSGPHARDYLLNPERGEITSGDGLRGDVLPFGYTVFAAYRVGGGADGNIGHDTLSAVPANAVNAALAPALAGLAKPLHVFQPFDATGGTPRETLRSAQARAFAVTHDVDKAVTTADFERLALATPGVPVGRVHAVPGMYPALPCYPAPGVVSLIVVPRCPLPAPMPSRALLDAVARYLEPRRLVTGELHVIAPCYRRVAVEATLNLACEVDAAAIVALAGAAIDAFFDPLTGGPDGRGWPIGRTVYRSEILALLADLSGVVRVTQFGLRELGDDAPRCDNVELCPYELVVPGHHRIDAVSYLPANLKRSDANECQPC
jgi:hypothetical protein